MLPDAEGAVAGAVFLAARFAVAFFAVAFFAVAFFAVDFFAVDFFAGAVLAVDEVPGLRAEDFLVGLAPGRLPRTTVKTGNPELVTPPVMAIF